MRLVMMLIVFLCGWRYFASSTSTPTTKCFSGFLFTVLLWTLPMCFWRRFMKLTIWFLHTISIHISSPTHHTHRAMVRLAVMHFCSVSLFSISSTIDEPTLMMLTSATFLYGMFLLWGLRLQLQRKLMLEVMPWFIMIGEYLNFLTWYTYYLWMHHSSYMPCHAQDSQGSSIIHVSLSAPGHIVVTRVWCASPRMDIGITHCGVHHNWFAPLLWLIALHSSHIYLS